MRGLLRVGVSHGAAVAIFRLTPDDRSAVPRVHSAMDRGSTWQQIFATLQEVGMLKFEHCAVLMADLVEIVYIKLPNER